MTLTPGKLGKLEAVRPHGLADLAVYAQGKLPAPPAAADVPVVGTWGMDGNDQYGDCTVAGAAHMVAGWNAEVHEADAVPSVTDVVDTYFELTTGEDSGLVEHTVLQEWYSTGLWGNRIAGYAPVDPKDLTALHQAIAFYGAAYVGVQLPQSAQTQFGAGQPWAVEPGSPILGGHCIVFVGYDAKALYAVSWGAVVEVTYPWWATYGDEAWAVLPDEFVRAGHDAPGIDLVSLRADLASV